MTSNQTTFNGYPQLGAKRAQWLHEDLGIESPQELARASVDEIDTALRARNQRLARNIIEDWIEKAQEDIVSLALISSPSSNVEQAEVPAALAFATAMHESAATALDPPSSNAVHKTILNPVNDWARVAAFIVEYQERVPVGHDEYRTHAYQIEADTSHLYGIIDNGAVWPGLEREELCQWMSARVKDSDAVAAQDAPTEIQHLDRPTVATIEIRQIQFVQPPDAHIPVAQMRGHQPLEGSLKSEEPFAIEIAFDLIGAEADVQALKHTLFFGQIFAHQRETRQDVHLGNTIPQPLAAAEKPYTTRLPAATLAAGEYQVSILVKFKVTPPIVGYISLPSLHVL